MWEGAASVSGPISCRVKSCDQRRQLLHLTVYNKALERRRRRLRSRLGHGRRRYSLSSCRCLIPYLRVTILQQILSNGSNPPTTLNWSTPRRSALFSNSDEVSGSDLFRG